MTLFQDNNHEMCISAGWKSVGRKHLLTKTFLWTVWEPRCCLLSPIPIRLCIRVAHCIWYPDHHLRTIFSKSLKSSILNFRISFGRIRAQPSSSLSPTGDFCQSPISTWGRLLYMFNNRSTNRGWCHIQLLWSWTACTTWWGLMYYKLFELHSVPHFRSWVHLPFSKCTYTQTLIKHPHALYQRNWKMSFITEVGTAI